MRGSLLARSDVKEATVEITVTRSDGRIERLGVVSYWHKNPLKRLMFKAVKQIKGIMK